MQNQPDTSTLWGIIRSTHPGWLTTWVVIYAVFLFAELALPQYPWAATIFKYGGIILNIFYVITHFKKDYGLILAVIFTWLADTFLLLDNHALIGVVVFAIAQLIHTIRLSHVNTKFFWFYGSALIIVFLAGYLIRLDPIIIAGFIYATLLSNNIYLSHKWYKKSFAQPNHGHATAAAAGFVLFASCDFCVMISFFSSTHVLPYYLLTLANFLAWAFYYPSQVLIANSSRQQDTQR